MFQMKQFVNNVKAHVTGSICMSLKTWLDWTYSASQWLHRPRCVVLTCRLQQTWTTSNSRCQARLVMSTSSATSPMKTAL